MSRLRHGYTNLTRRLDQRLVEKRYVGADASARCQIEHACLVHLADHLPVPEVLACDHSIPTLTLRDMAGIHGQDAIAAGGARSVLELLGRLLTRLQTVTAAAVPGLPGRGSVIVHGDFGPQNILIDAGAISALLDWEFAHIGQPVEDLAWTEWIVRMHHPDQVDSLQDFFDAAQLHIPWTDRHQAMVARCDALRRRAANTGSAELWNQRLQYTQRWVE